jgi:hypothetical protein
VGESWVSHCYFNNDLPLAGVGRTDAMILSVAEVVIFGIVPGTLAGAATAVGFIAWNR